MRFTELFEGWQQGRLTQQEAAQVLGVCERSFRRYMLRFEDEGLEGLIDRRLGQVSHRRAPLDEVMVLAELYRARYSGWNVRHFHSWYRREHEGARSYSWVKKALQANGLIERIARRGAHRKRRECAALAGMMLHQDGSRHRWVAQALWDLIVTMDDATNEHYSMFFVEEEGTASSFRGVSEVIAAHGLFASLYSDRGSHYWFSPEAGGKVDKTQPTQFGRAMAQLGIEMIAAYSPQARGRSERAFRTHQDRLPKELAAAGISDMEQANRYLLEVYRPVFNAEFAHPARESATAFVPFIDTNLSEILCEHFERRVSNDNCVRFEGRVLQIPVDRHRCHYVKAKVRVHRYPDQRLAVFHGPRCLARYEPDGSAVAEAALKAVA